jgi:hypothetical protein
MENAFISGVRPLNAKFTPISNHDSFGGILITPPLHKHPPEFFKKGPLEQGETLAATARTGLPHRFSAALAAFSHLDQSIKLDTIYLGQVVLTPPELKASFPYL